MRKKKIDERVTQLSRNQFYYHHKLPIVVKKTIKAQLFCTPTHFFKTIRGKAIHPPWHRPVASTPLVNSILLEYYIFLFSLGHLVNY